METVVIVLMGLVCFNFMLKQTYLQLNVVAVIAVVSAVFVGLSWPYAIEQSKTQIADWLANPALMLDTAVVLSVEVVLQMTFCLVAADVQTAAEVRKPVRWAYLILRGFPGILFFPVLFCILVATIFAFPGISFPLIAWTVAAGVLVVIPTGSWLLGWLLPEKKLRLELLFLTHALMALLGIIATVNGRTAVAGVSEVDWGALGGVMVLLLTVGGIGFLRRKRRCRLMNRC